MPETEILGELTVLLNSEDRHAMERAFPAVYDELRRLAAKHLRGERPDHTLSATGLVHEAFLKLSGQDRANITNRAQFFAIASTAMRRILVNYARDRGREKRGGGGERVPLDAAHALPGLSIEDRHEEVLTVDRLLQRLGQIDPRAVRVVECRYFGGFTNEETAHALDVSTVTVKRAWRLSQAWMARELTA